MLLVIHTTLLTLTLTQTPNPAPTLRYFDNVKSVERESPIRLLSLKDIKNGVKFRNGFANTSLITGVVTKCGQGHCEIEVRENWGLRVVVKDKDGQELVVWGRELRRCASNKHGIDEPYEARSHHDENRRTLKQIKVTLTQTLTQPLP